MGERANGGVPSLEERLAWWRPLRDALGPTLSAASPRVDMPLWRDYASGKAKAADAGAVAAGAVHALRASEEALAAMELAEGGTDLRAMEAAAIDEMAAEGLRELARMGFFQEAIEALGAVSGPGSALDPRKALASLCEQASQEEDGGWRSGLGEEARLTMLAESPAWLLAQALAGEKKMTLRQERSDEQWPLPVALLTARASRPRASPEERAGAGRALRKIFEVAAQKQVNWKFFCGKAAKEIGRSKIAAGAVPEEVWDVLPLEVKVELGCGHGGGSKIGSRSFERLAVEVARLSGPERDTAGAALSAAAWMSFDGLILDRLEKAFPQEEPAWLERGLRGLGMGGPIWEQRAFQALRDQPWARKALVGAGLMTQSEEKLSWVSRPRTPSEWGPAFEALRAARLAKAIKKQVPRPQRNSKKAPRL